MSWKNVKRGTNRKEIMTDDTRNKVLSVLHKIERGVSIGQKDIRLLACVPKDEVKMAIDLIEGKKGR